MYIRKKISTNKISLLTAWRTEILALAAASAATPALAFAATAVANNLQAVHDFHLLSYRSLSINRVKKTGGSARLLSNLIG
jgi:hypothetical protein